MEFTLHNIENASEASQELLKGAKKQMGMVPNLLKVFAESPAALEGYLDLSGLLQKTDFSKEEQQLLILAISVENKCHYCVAAHSTTTRHQLNIDDEIVDAVRNGNPVPDKKLNALVSYAKKVVKKRGFVSDEDVKAFLDAGYSKRNLLEVNLALAMKTLSNYTNHLAETPVDDALQAETKEFEEAAV